MLSSAIPVKFVGQLLYISLYAMISLATVVSAADFYVYKARDGTTWYTDHRLPHSSYTLLAKIHRSPASVSCGDAKPITMEHRAQNHAAVIKRYSQTYNVDHLIVKAMIRVESCFDKYAVSRVGAKGLMQLTAATAKRMGVRNVFNAQDNIRGGIRYFSEMMEKFGQNTKLALAAYNAGPEAVEKYNGIPPFEETQRYVRRVIKIYELYKTSESQS